MAYFDNAATTFPKPECVYDFMDGFIEEVVEMLDVDITSRLSRLVS